MAKDEFKNLGFKEDKPAADPKKDGEDKGGKGELRWQREESKGRQITHGQHIGGTPSASGWVLWSFIGSRGHFRNSIVVAETLDV